MEQMEQIQSLETARAQMREECTRLRRENKRLLDRMHRTEGEPDERMVRQSAKNRALLEGKEIWIQQLEMCIMMEEREQAKVRNPLFW